METLGLLLQNEAHRIHCHRSGFTAITKKPNLLLMLMSRCVNAIFVRFQFEYTVESKQCSVIFIRYLLNVIYLLALSRLRLPSLKPADNQNFEITLVLLSGWKIILKLID